MPMNRIQFQHGVSLPEFFERYGSQEQCAAALTALRWPQGFRCPRCESPEHDIVGHGSHCLFQCRACRRQTSLTAGTVLDSTRLPLRTWFLAMFLISRHKTGLSSLALMRHLGTSYRTAWLIHHKLMAAMAEHDAQDPLGGNVQLDDAYLGGERPGVGGRADQRPGPSAAPEGLARGNLQPRGHRPLGLTEPAAWHLVAQQLLRHKTSKTSFVAMFWVTVIANVAGFVGLHAGLDGLLALRRPA